MSSNFEVGNESESGRLCTTIMHRPGNELLRLTDKNLDELLFDKIPNINETHESHDIFTKYLRDHGMKVLYVRDLLTETLQYSSTARDKLIDGIIKNSLYKQDSLDVLRNWLSQRTAEELVDAVIVGVSPRHENAPKLCDHVNEFIIPPLPNLLFTRDAFVVIEKNVFILRMAKAARQNEPLIYRVIFQYHPELSTSGLTIVDWEKLSNNQENPTIEGGDIAYYGNGTLLIGCGERTNRSGIESLTRTGCFSQVIAIKIPPQRDYMHLDTVLSTIGKHAFILHSKVANEMEVFTVESHDSNRNLLDKPIWTSYGSNIHQALKELLKDPDLMFYDAADDDASTIDQQECRHNVLAIDDCHILTYSGGDENRGLVSQYVKMRYAQLA